MNKYFQKLFTVIFSGAVLIGIPWVAHIVTGNPGCWGFLSFSWIPALLVFMYLADD